MIWICLNATKQNVLNWSLHVFVFMSSLIKLLLTRQQFVKSLHKCVCAKNESYLHTTVYAFIDRCTKNIFSLKMHFYDYFSTLLYTQYMVFKIRFSGQAFNSKVHLWPQVKPSQNKKGRKISWRLYYRNIKLS